MRNSRGFTMIEILVAMGILVILIGIVAFTVSGITRGAREKETKVRMQALTAMLTELETANKLTKQPARMYFGPAATVHDSATDGPFDIWRDGDPSDNTSGPPEPAAKPIECPTIVTEEAFRGGKDDRAKAAAVLNTQLVMGLLASMPVNRSAIDKTSSQAFMTNPVADPNIVVTRLGSLGVVDLANKRSALKPPLFVDAWNNPIIFVPSAGLTGVTLKEHGTDRHIINSTGAIFEEADIANYRTPATARPFFASAGPDGDFSAGDDNVYSFEE